MTHRGPFQPLLFCDSVTPAQPGAGGEPQQEPLNWGLLVGQGCPMGRGPKRQRRALLPTGRAFGTAGRWDSHKGGSWRCTSGTWPLPRLLGPGRWGEGEGGLGRTFCVSEISRAWWARMKCAHWDSPGLRSIILHLDGCTSPVATKTPAGAGLGPLNLPGFLTAPCSTSTRRTSQPARDSPTPRARGLCPPGRGDGS